MKISQEYKDLIVGEFEEVDQSLQNNQDPNDFLYFFSASFGILNRVMNIQCDPTLVFMHQILQSLHQSMQARLQAAGINQSSTMAFPIVFLTKMREILQQLRAAFMKGSDTEIHSVLSRAANLTYASSGNGYYLFIRQKLSI